MLNQFASGVMGGIKNRDQSSLGITGSKKDAMHMLELDPRSSILTQDAPAALSSSGRQSYCGATGESFFKISPFFEQCPANPAHSPSDNGDGHIGIFASGAMQAIKPAEVGGATDCHPGRFDKRPLQPSVAALE